VPDFLRLLLTPDCHSRRQATTADAQEQAGARVGDDSLRPSEGHQTRIIRQRMAVPHRRDETGETYVVEEGKAEDLRKKRTARP
jgi:hypothetical protein